MSDDKTYQDEGAATGTKVYCIVEEGWLNRLASSATVLREMVSAAESQGVVFVCDDK